MDIKFREYVNGKFHYWGFVEEGIFKGPVTPSLTRGCHSRYTGLKDEKGKEIYEGDVVAIHDLNGSIDYHEEIDTYSEDRPLRQIKWNQSGGFIIEWDYGYYELTLLGWAIDVEVIGNIYENPDLLSPPKET